MTLQGVIAFLLKLIALVMLTPHDTGGRHPTLAGAWLVFAGVAAGLVIGSRDAGVAGSVVVLTSTAGDHRRRSEAQECCPAC